MVYDIWYIAFLNKNDQVTGAEWQTIIEDIICRYIIGRYKVNGDEYGFQRYEVPGRAGAVLRLVLYIIESHMVLTNKVAQDSRRLI